MPFTMIFPKNANKPGVAHLHIVLLGEYFASEVSGQQKAD